MKIQLNIVILLLAATIGFSQGAPEISTNYFTTNYIAASSYGSSLLTGASNDMRYFSRVTWILEFQGAGTDNTGTMSIYFADAFDRSNTKFLTSTNYALTVTANGTNRVTGTLDVTNYGYTFQTPARYSNTVANALTNATLWSTKKFYLKGQ